MLRIVPHSVPRVSRSCELFPDGFELHLLLVQPTPLHACHDVPLVGRSSDADDFLFFSRYQFPGEVQDKGNVSVREVPQHQSTMSGK